MFVIFHCSQQAQYLARKLGTIPLFQNNFVKILNTQLLKSKFLDISQVCRYWHLQVVFWRTTETTSFTMNNNNIIQTTIRQRLTELGSSKITERKVNCFSVLLTFLFIVLCSQNYFSLPIFQILALILKCKGDQVSLFQNCVFFFFFFAHSLHK